MSEIDKAAARKDKIRIADEVIATIAGIAASEVDGVISMSGGLADGIADMLGKKNLGKGVKVEAGEKEAVIELSVTVEYGCKIHMVAREIQSKVREAIENMTGLKVVEVNVSVLGINIKEPKKELAPEENSKAE